MPGPIYRRTHEGALAFGNDAIELRFDPSSGYWLDLTDCRSGRAVIRNPERGPSLTVVSGGHEVVTSDIRNPEDPPLAGEARYPAKECLGHELLRGDDGDTLVLALRAGPWRVRQEWHLQPESDIARLRVAAVWEGEGSERLRHILFAVPLLAVGPVEQVTYEAPGLPIAPHQALTSLSEGWGMSIGDTPTGTPGLVGLCDRESGQVALLWSFSPAEPTYGTVRREADGIRIDYRLLLADELEPGEGVAGGGFYVRTNTGAWEPALRDFHHWYASVGLAIPPDRPSWTERASLYELHIGNAVVAEGPYEPLPTVKDLLARLPYIKSLGFNTVQIMPRQFYAGYSVHDYYDVTTQHGDEDVLRQVIKTAHSMGLRVIFDLVIHGCNDKVVARQTYERSGHLFPEWLLRWAEVAPDRSSYLDSHPEWFLRDEDGEIRCTYTWAFDHLNDSYQRYLIDVMRYYLVDLGADGFRVDAPTWNFLPNWQPGLPYRAGDSYYGWARLFARARRILKAAKPDAMLYAEGNGPLYVRDFDIRYDYDAQWLFGALLEARDPRAADWHPPSDSRRITAREMAEWLHERRLAHPPGTVVAHHIDSHDSFWGHALFRRQVYGLDAWRPCFAMCALIDGCIMQYIGGELGNEEFVRCIMRLRRGLPEIKRGTCDYTVARLNDEMVFAPLRSYGVLHTVPVMNFCGEARRVTLGLPVDAMDLAPTTYTVYDALNDQLLRSPPGRRWGKAELARIELELPPFGVAVLVLRPVPTSGLPSPAW